MACGATRRRSSGVATSVYNGRLRLTTIAMDGADACEASAPVAAMGEDSVTSKVEPGTDWHAANATSGSAASIRRSTTRFEGLLPFTFRPPFDWSLPAQDRGVR